MLRQVSTGLLLSTFLCAGPGLAVVDAGLPDPSRPVTVDHYSLGDTIFVPTGLEGTGRGVEFTAVVHSPTDLSGGPFPLVLFIHGVFDTCGTGLEFPDVDGDGIPDYGGYPWPCSSPSEIRPNYRGFDYVAEVLASHGYIVVSVSANGLSAAQYFLASSEGGDALARAELLQTHLGFWQYLDTQVDLFFAGKFNGKVDLDRVGTLGHSRGGDGVVRHALLNESLGSPYGIRAVMPLASTNKHRAVLSGTPLGVVLPYCDGDVANLDGVHFFDDARYDDPQDEAPKHSILLLGANHNYFNSIWTQDDWTAGARHLRPDENSHCGFQVPGNGRLTSEQQRAAFLPYGAAFFRRYLGGEPGFAPLLKGDASPPPSAGEPEIFVSYHPPASERLDINRLLDDTHLAVNTQGGAVGQEGLIEYETCGALDVDSTDQRCTEGPGGSGLANAEPHARGLSQVRLTWEAAGARFANEIPQAVSDFSAYRNLQFRVGLNFEDPLNPVELPQDLAVVLRDGTGVVRSAPVSAHSEALYYPPGLTDLDPPLVGLRQLAPRILLNTVRIPLTAFSGLDLRDVTSVDFEFETPSGALLASDIALADRNAPPIVNAGPDRTVECTVSAGTPVALEASLVKDPDGDPLTHTWTGPGGTVEGATPTVALPIGEHLLSTTVTDALGADSTDTVTVTIGGDASGDGDVCEPLVSLSVGGQIVGSSLLVSGGQAIRFHTHVSEDVGLGFPIFAWLGNETPITYLWNFDGGGVANPLVQFAKNPLVTFDVPEGSLYRDFQVQVTVFDSSGNSSVQTVVVTAIAI